MTYDVGARCTRMKLLCTIVSDLALNYILTLLSFSEDGLSVSKPLICNDKVSECVIPLLLYIVHSLLGSTYMVEDIISSLYITIPIHNFSDIVVARGA